jgi:hypothetical protein
VIICYQNFSAAVIQQAADFIRSQSCIQWYKNSAGPDCGKIIFKVNVTVSDKNRYAISGL